MTEQRNDEKAFAQAWLRLLKSRSTIDNATTVNEVIETVRDTARSITLADGITFVRRTGDQCHYMVEDAISPLWLNRRFPLTHCISGWCMREKQSVIIEDIYADPRVPADAYRPTFVHSLAMVPVGLQHPVAAIGAYWARAGSPAKESVFFLQGLAGAVERALDRLPEDLAEMA
jgi:hypothetical protein